jgi:predicted porin
MKKSLLALAALFVAGLASAQTPVLVYGIADAGIASVTGGTAGRELKMTSGGRYSNSHIGFRGTEDLGNGMSVLYKLEAPVNLKTGGDSGFSFNREALVGLSGSLGTLTAGLQYTPFWDASASLDPMGTGMAGRAFNLVGTSDFRMSNSIRYALPSFGGFTANFGYEFGEVPGDTAAGRSFGFSFGYVQGPFTAVAAHHDRNRILTTAPVVSTEKVRNSLLGGVYTFDMVKVHLAYGVNKTTEPTGITQVDDRDMLAGLSLSFGASAVLASYVRKDDRTFANMDANQIGVAYVYALSKRTSLYASAARIRNSNGATFSTQNASFGGTREINAGLFHAF